MEMQEYVGADQELFAIAAINNKRDAVNNAHNEIANGMSVSFDLLALGRCCQVGYNRLACVSGCVVGEVSCRGNCYDHHSHRNKQQAGSGFC